MGIAQRKANTARRKTKAHSVKKEMVAHSVKEKGSMMVAEDVLTEQGREGLHSKRSIKAQEK
jgi:hypothetical protein